MSLDDYPEYLAEGRRRALLHILTEAGGHANDRELLAGLHYVGHQYATEQMVAADLTMFEGAGLVTISWAKDKIRVAHMTPRGVQCFAGRIQVKGIKRPEIIG